MLQNMTTEGCQHIHAQQECSKLMAASTHMQYGPAHACWFQLSCWHLSTTIIMLLCSLACQIDLASCCSPFDITGTDLLAYCSADLWLHVSSCPELGMVTLRGSMVALTLHARRICQLWALLTCATAALEACLNSWAGQTHSGRTARQKDSLGVSRMC